jgi:hypothetical protein
VSGMGGGGLRSGGDGLVVGGAGRDHGEHEGGVVNRDVDDARAGLGEGVGEGGERVGIGGVDTHAAETEGSREGGEVGNGVEARGGVVLRVEQLLLLAHEAEVAVVEDQHGDGEVEFGEEGEFLDVHQDRAVAGNARDAAGAATPGVTQGEGGADGGGEAEAHGAEAAGREERAGRAEGPGLGDPHLVLADVGGDDRVGGERSGEETAEVDRVQRIFGAWRMRERVGAAEDLRVGEPGGAVCGMMSQLRHLSAREEGEEAGENGRGIADEAEEGVFDFSDFGGVDVDVGDGRARAELGDFAGGAVVEAGADREDEVGFVEELVGRFRAVHAEHAHEMRVVGGDRAERHQRADGGRLQAVGEFAGERSGAGGDDAAAEIEDGALGVGGGGGRGR